MSILIDDEKVCDVKFFDGKKTTSISNDSDCKTDNLWVEEVSFNLTREIPLVGFHGHIMGNEIFTSQGSYMEYYLESLGLILFDNMSEICVNGLDVDVDIPGSTPEE